MIDTAAALAGYARFYETLTRERLRDLRGLVTADVGFKDPFNDVRGPDAMIRVMEGMFERGTPRFEVLDRAVSDRAGYLLWRYTSERNGRPPWVIEGMSELRFDDDGRVIEHVDHWDAAEQVYERLPVIGALVRWVKRRLRS